MNPCDGGVLSAPARCLRLAHRLMLVAMLCLSPAGIASETEPSPELQALTTERELITSELTQLRKTIALLQGSARPGTGKSSETVKRLNAEILILKLKLIELSKQEIALLEAEITSADDPVLEPEPVIESKPLRTQTPDYSDEAEAAQVTQLRKLLKDYYVEEELAREIGPSAEEVVAREAASRDAAQLDKIPFNVSKVRLSGAEASIALAQVTRRLANPDIPETRRYPVPVYSVKTHLFGNLIASEQRSMTPVGKYHYISRIELQPGDTTVHMLGYRWQVNLPDDIHTQAYLITLYKPPGTKPEFHIFSIEELLAEEHAHIPAWLPEQAGIPGPR